MKEREPRPSKIERIQEELRRFLTDAQPGTVKFAALSDFLDINNAQNETPQQTTLIEFYQHRITVRSAKVRGYQEALQRVKRFRARFEKAFRGSGEEEEGAKYWAVAELAFMGSCLRNWGKTFVTFEELLSKN